MYGFVAVHGSGFPLLTSEPYATRAEALEEANRAYRRAVNTGYAHGIRFGKMDSEGRVKGKLVMVKSHRKYPIRGPFV